MRLEVCNVKKNFGERVILDDISYQFNDHGFYIVVGDSGCGKSTLLNMLSTLDSSYEGDIFFEAKNLRKLSDKESRDLRLHEFGFVFQSFNLLEDDTVLNNIRMNLDSLCSLDDEYKNKRIEEIINLLDLKEIKNSVVKNISGGEKQRVAIARAIIHSPKILFCDEPTGSLDSVNSKIVFRMLKILSKSTLVICVSHDIESSKMYADEIITLKNGKFFHKFNDEAKVVDSELNIMCVKNKKKEAKFSFKTMFSHIKSKFSQRKFRYFFRNAMFSLCLVTSALAITLTTTLNNSISSAFSSILSENSIVLTKKNSSNGILDFYTVNKNKVFSLLNDYKDDLDYYGVRYFYDFENGFPDSNELYQINGAFKEKISGFSARSFNEFIYIDSINELQTYPHIENELHNDEIVISISYDQMKDLCKSLQIIRDFNSLGSFISNNDLFVSLELANYSWQYSDEQLFKVKGVILDTKNRVYHTNQLFNEELFEEKMRFPSSTNFKKADNLPRTFKRLMFVHTNKHQSIFLNKIFLDRKYKDILFENDSSLYSPLSNGNEKSESNILFVFETFSDSIDCSILDNLEELNFKYNDYYFSSNGGYFNNGSSIFTGFARPTFFSASQSKIDEVIDAHSLVEESDFYNIKVPEGVVNAYAFNNASDNVKIKVTKSELKIDEIIISGGFARILKKQFLLNEYLYITLMDESVENDGKILNHFKTVKLKINNIIEEDNSISIYHDKNYSISLFRDIFKLSCFNLIPNSIVFEMDHSVEEDELKKLNSLFADYEFKNPLVEISKSINESTSFLKILLVIFSVVSLISCLLLSLIITLVNAKEQKREISLFVVLGYRNSEISKLFFMDNLVHSIISLILSIATLIVLNFTLGSALGNIVGASKINIFSPLMLIVLIFITFFISFFSNIAIFNVIKHTNIQENIH